MPVRPPAGPIEVTAHRGDPTRAPENTLVSLRAGIEGGADAVEWDIHICATGEPVVIHDETVDRTTDGRGAVAELALDELRGLDAGRWFSEDTAGARIPTLDEVLDLVRPEGVRAYCEVKALRRPDDAGGVVEALRRREMLQRTAVISLRPEILVAFRRRSPSIRLAWVVAREREMAPALDWVRDDAHGVLAPAAELLLAHPGRTRALVAEGLPLGTWTVDDEETAAALLDLGVRRITTNRVRELVAWARSAESAG